MKDDFDAILAAFRAIPEPGRPGYYKGFCTVHKGGCERRPSLSIAVTDDRILIRCFVCGPSMTRSIVEAAGFRMSQLFVDSPSKGKQMAKDPTAEFIYKDETGKVLYKACRYDYEDRKSFGQYRFDHEKNVWLPGIGPEPGVPGAAFSTRRVLYNLPMIVAHPDQPVIVTEGEGKADLLISWGLVGASCVGGAGMSWLPCYSESLKGRRVAILPDNDPPGFRHAETVIGSLVRHGVQNIRLVLLPNLPPKGDIIDYARAGGSRADLLKIIKETTTWGPLS